jgi:hypothetical protein
LSTELTSPSAAPHAEAKARLAEAVQQLRGEIVDLSQRIHANPEPAFEEHQAARWVAEVMAEQPGAMQLRLLGTLLDVAAEKNSTLIFPIPVELLKFAEAAAAATGRGSSQP